VISVSLVFVKLVFWTVRWLILFDFEGDLSSDRSRNWHRRLLLCSRKHLLLVLCTMYSQKRLRKQLSYTICRPK
jgi:hypothetical protein